MIAVQVTIWISPSSLSTFLPAFEEVVRNALAEPECAFLNVYQNDEDPGKFFFIEHWNKDRAWFENVQLKKKYYEPYLQVTKPLWVKDRVVEYYEISPIGHSVQSA
ncbi:hypothetical protein NA57DRAFT_59090 [Rhizodiscina lignyota]|uniref:ABM domain-containing protein n=1 Tax=Rhizodiscina lignyota TaxID=1504668 RepID=A0A9P4ID48_9PEZI|nr:hypothetical protein NA57DRAFT_59090 [Rhizodiscina lignyota]